MLRTSPDLQIRTFTVDEAQNAKQVTDLLDVLIYALHPTMGWYGIVFHADQVGFARKFDLESEQDVAHGLVEWTRLWDESDLLKWFDDVRSFKADQRHLSERAVLATKLSLVGQLIELPFDYGDIVYLDEVVWLTMRFANLVMGLGR